MDNKELQDHIIEIIKQLSRMDAKLSTLCDRTKDTDEKVDRLPCDKHSQLFMKEISTRVPTRLFMWLIGLIMIVLVGSFSYTKSIDGDLHAHINGKHVPHVEETP